LKFAAPMLVLVIAAVSGCALFASDSPKSADVAELETGTAPDRPRPVNVGLALDRDRYGFDDFIQVDMINITDHDVAHFGLCGAQVLGRRGGDWHSVWFVDCSRSRMATRWIAPGAAEQFPLKTAEWAAVANEDHDAYVIRHMGAVTEPFRLDADRR